MKICYLDAFSGISGDMTVGALVDAGADPQAVIAAVASLGVHAAIEKTKRGGVTASKFRVQAESSPGHRHLSKILEMIARSAMSERAKRDASSIFSKLGDAEARVHGLDIEKVHFHEVGAVDSIADICGACVALDSLAIDELRCSAINLGSGTVKTEHGILPVPAPATALLLENKPVYSRGPEVELTTPTGAAILAALATDFGAMPALRIQSIGYGAGDRDFKEQPNVLRAIVGEQSRAPEATQVSVIEANIDDSSAQVLGYAIERLMGAGALDASLSPLLMKKGRPGSLLCVLARPEDQEKLVRLIFAETSTLGLRIYSAERRVEERSITDVETQFGKIRMKVSGEKFAPEYDDCRAAAERTGEPLARVIAAANQAYLRLKR